MAMQENQLRFRKASSGDVEQLVEHRVRQLLDEGYPEVADIRSNLSEYFLASLENGSLVCWVGLVDERIVATAGLCFYQLPPTFTNPGGDVAYITNMYTHPDFRGQGIASGLLNKLIAEAKSLNYPGVRLHASEMGRGLYERAGFSDTHGYMALQFF